MSRKKPHISECDLSRIGGRFAYVRLYNNLNQAEFADITGLSNGNISGIENHKYEPSYRAILKILEIFNVSADWLIKGVGEFEIGRAHV
jgi:transcriptional regulator with XRE-family HTH domain